MREGTSGFWLEEKKDGSICIGYEDYGVDTFGGGDFERTYTLDRANAEKFKAALKERYSGTLEKMIEAAFGREFRDREFMSLCREKNIEYESMTWAG